MVADELRILKPGISDDDLEKIKTALAGKFKAEKGKDESDEVGENKEGEESSKGSSSTDRTGQLVFFPPPFAKEIAGLISNLMDNGGDVPFKAWVNGKKKEKDQHKEVIKRFENEMFKKSKSLTVDIGLFGRMTTSDLVVNVEAACQVAHAIGTHEAFIESDYFTAMDDQKSKFASTQTEKTGAAFLGSGETETFFNSVVYYKYLNLDLDALKKHLSWQDGNAAKTAGALVAAAALGTPTGKQNSFAAHGLPDLILIEASETKRPMSYANAFLKPVEGGTSRNLMTESANALKSYIDSVAAAFEPSDMKRVLFAVGPAAIALKDATIVTKIDKLPETVEKLVASK